MNGFLPLFLRTSTFHVSCKSPIDGSCIRLIKRATPPKRLFKRQVQYIVYYWSMSNCQNVTVLLFSHQQFYPRTEFTSRTMLFKGLYCMYICTRHTAQKERLILALNDFFSVKIVPGRQHRRMSSSLFFRFDEVH